MDVLVLHAGEVVHAQRLGLEPLHLGRAPTNDLVLPRVDVSGHHAMLYRDDGRVWLKDLGSSNGTFVNDRRVRQPATVTVGDRIRLGAATHLKLAEGDDLPRAPLRLERADGALGWAVTDVAFPVPGAGDVTLLVYGDELWLAVDGMEERQLSLGEPFDVHGQSLVLREVTGPTPDTVRPASSAYPYRLQVALQADEATLTHLATQARVRITSAHRVAMLYALGQRWLDDGEAGPARGWIDDDQLAVAVWGRSHTEHGTNNLHVLVHRIRKEVAEGGFDRWFLEKRAGRTRVRLAEVELLD